MNIPGYKLGREIAAGEFCSIYNALEIETSKTVTIRFFHQELSSNPEFCRHVKKHSNLLLNKTIGNITAIKKIVADPQNCYLITDYFPCASNQQPLQTQFTIDEVLQFGWQLASSLSEMHELGLVHGAVSTTNIIFPNLAQVTLGPVSLQRTLKTETPVPSLSTSLHESQYIAPEYSTGLVTRSDFFSLGVVLFELLFKVKPFTAENQQQLQLDKENMAFTVPADSARKLIPLFNKLLDPDPDRRVSNAKMFLSSAEQCGYKIETSDSKAQGISSSVAAAVNTDRRSMHGKNIIVYSAIVGFLMVGVLSFFMLGDSPVENPRHKISSPVILPDVLPVDKPVNIKKFIQPENSDIARTLLEKSQRQILQNNYGAALISINDALKESPDLAAAKKIKQQIEFEFEVRSYLGRAGKQLELRKITGPANDNAVDTYRQLASLLPAGDNRALEGLQKIATNYYINANNLVLKKQYDDAKKHISTGLIIFPGHARLKQLDLYISLEGKKQIEQKKIQAKRRIEQQNKIRLQQQQAAKREQQRQQQLIEQNRQAELERQQRRIEQEKERERINQLRMEQDKVDRMISDAEDILRATPLSLQSLSNALEIQTRLTTSSVDDPRIVELYQQITDSYVELARDQKEAADFSEAIKTIDQGLALEKNNPPLRQIKNEINTLISEAEKKKKQLPVIGTF